jgi:hypothetical protein
MIPKDGTALATDESCLEEQSCRRRHPINSDARKRCRFSRCLFDVSAEPKLEAIMTDVSKFLVAALLLTAHTHAEAQPVAGSFATAEPTEAERRRRTKMEAGDW